MKIALNEIVVEDGRFRDATGDMAALAASLEKFGQLVPLIVTNDNRLVAGFRRYTAVKRLGWSHVEVVVQDNISKLLQKEIELEENIQREDMDWKERVRAISALDELKKQLDPNWSQIQTGAVLGMERSHINEAVKLSKLMSLFPELENAKSITQALSWASSKAQSVVRLKEVKSNPAQFQEIEKKIWQGDSCDVIKSLPTGQFHAIVTDSPFGIDYDRRKAGVDQADSAYEDSAKSYERILSMAPDIFRVLKDNAFCVWFLGPSWWWPAKLAFTEAGFLVDEIPVIWYRQGGRAYTTRPDRYLGRQYDMALWCLKGNPEMTPYGRSHSNVLPIAPVPGDERELLVERPIELYQELIKCITVEGETVADFFVGSGSVPAAAVSLGRDYFGVELDAARRATAINKIKANTP